MLLCAAVPSFGSRIEEYAAIETDVIQHIRGWEPSGHAVRQPTKLIFLPGAGGDPLFWRPVSDLLAHRASRTVLGWPGFGGVPSDPKVKGMQDLIAMTIAEIDRPSALIAQSMGGAIALQATLARPELITHLVLTATSGGVDMSGVGAADWRSVYLKANPMFPRWFADYHDDISDLIGAVRAPTLLVLGDADPISPVAIGERLQRLLPKSRLHVLPGGEHDLALKLASQVAPLIDAHLESA